VGLCPSLTAPELAPPGKHVTEPHVGTAPYRLAEGVWKVERERLARRTIAAVAEWMPNLPDLISDWRCLDPEDFEREFGLVEANMTHGDLAAWNQFWMRPLPGLHAYRTPTRGLYLSGNGTWPGNFISGPQRPSASRAVLDDLEAARGRGRRSRPSGTDAAGPDPSTHPAEPAASPDRVDVHAHIAPVLPTAS
jgi:phytoene dehydrogenase-like protein